MKVLYVDNDEVYGMMIVYNRRFTDPTKTVLCSRFVSPEKITLIVGLQSQSKLF